MSDKGKIYLVFVILAVAIVLFLIRSTPSQVAESPGPSPSVSTSAMSDDLANWKTFSSDKYGFQIKYPDNYLLSINQNLQASPSLIASLSTGELPVSNPTNIFIKYLGNSSDFKNVMAKDAVFDPKSDHPTFDQFQNRPLGENQFYFLKTGLFEGVLSLNYYLVNSHGIFGFYLHSTGVDWTNPDFDSENFFRHVEFKKMLSSLKFNQ